ncbi:MAG TPA: hypothetical protein VFH31_07705 [Pyrinomonadaceae bacterium]|nr:hypothetical protein [Pyrinomonadaceae bacterium]
MGVSECVPLEAQHTLYINGSMAGLIARQRGRGQFAAAAPPGAQYTTDFYYYALEMERFEVIEAAKSAFPQPFPGTP